MSAQEKRVKSMNGEERIESLEPRPPSLLDAILPIVVLIGLIALTIVLFGVDAAEGPLQVALLIAAAFASLIALKNGHSIAKIRDSAVGGVSSAMGAIFILLAVGAVIGTWNMSGTIPTVVSYGIGLLSANWFYVAAAIVCGVVGMITGSSWTTAGTLGVAFVGIATVIGVSPEIAAGAVISGAYFGDKMTPLSETTILVPQLVGGLTVMQHIRAMVWTAVPAIVLSLVGFAILGLTGDVTEAVDKQAAQDAIESVFNISALNLVPLFLMIYLTFRQVPPFLALLSCALLAGGMAPFTQSAAVEAFAGGSGQGSVATGIEAIYGAMANGFVSSSGIEPIDALFSRGGMASMLTTIWLILGALSFAAIVEHAGFLDRLLAPIVSWARSTGRLIFSVVASGAGLNVIAGDQYVADVLPARMFRGEFARRKLAPHVLSSTVENAGTVTSVLVPWNSCGAYISGVLGVSTISYLPYCFFSIFSPILAIIFGFIGFRMDRLPDAASDETAATTELSRPAVAPGIDQKRKEA
jgi:Na+:H+ antiporter, NhaC family